MNQRTVVQIGTAYQDHGTASKLASLADQILTPTAVALNSTLLSVEDCRALLAATVEQPPCSGQEAAQLGRLLTGAFRRADFDDPDIYTLGVAANFAEFPASIGRQVIDPVKGLPSKLKFPPTIAEVREALEAAMTKRRAIAYRAQWMLDERNRRDAETARHESMTPERRAAVLARVNALISQATSSGTP